MQQKFSEKPIYTQVRIDEKTFYKSKILAAIYNELRKYESEHGELPDPVPQDPVSE